MENRHKAPMPNLPIENLGRTETQIAGAECSGPVMRETDCRFEFQGQTFSADGAWVTEKSAGVYVVGDVHRDATGKVTDWLGNDLGVWRVVSRWGRLPFGRMASLRVTLGPNSPLPGSKWYGRMGYEWTQLLRLRRAQS